MSVVLDSLTSCKTCMANGLSSLLGLDQSSVFGALDFSPMQAPLETDFNNLLDQNSAELTGDLKELLDAEAYTKKKKVESKVATVHDNQDSAKSMSFSEPQPITKGVSSVVDNKPVDYSTNINYSESYGKVDKSNNWYRVNEQTGEVEFVHNSGSFLKLDKAGNATIHIAGSLKFIVDQDSIIQSNNMSLIAKAKGMFKSMADLFVVSQTKTSVNSTSGTDVNSASVTTVNGSTVKLG